MSDEEWSLNEELRNLQKATVEVVIGTLEEMAEKGYSLQQVIEYLKKFAEKI